jgi:hypothetical protein
MNLFLVPANPDNERASLARTVQFSIAERFLRSHDLLGLQKALGGERPFHCWAMKEGSRPTFGKMEPNDEALFFISGTDLCRYRARVIFKAESGEFGKAIWPHESLDWKLIYFLDDVEAVTVNKWLVMSAFGYDDPKDVLPGIRRVRDECVLEIFDKYGSTSQFLDAINSAPASEPLRLRCADLSIPRHAFTGSRQKRRIKVAMDEREALRQAIKIAGCPLPPANDASTLIKRVSDRAAETNLPLPECAVQVLDEYLMHRKTG